MKYICLVRSLHSTLTIFLRFRCLRTGIQPGKCLNVAITQIYRLNFGHYFLLVIFSVFSTIVFFLIILVLVCILILLTKLTLAIALFYII